MTQRDVGIILKEGLPSELIGRSIKINNNYTDFKITTKVNLTEAAVKEAVIKIFKKQEFSIIEPEPMKPHRFVVRKAHEFAEIEIREEYFRSTQTYEYHIYLMVSISPIEYEYWYDSLPCAKPRILL